MPEKKDKAMLLADAVSVKETTVPSIVLENINLLEQSSLSQKKKNKCLKKMRLILKDVSKHEKIFSGLLRAEVKKQNGKRTS